MMVKSSLSLQLQVQIKNLFGQKQKLKEIK